MALTDLLSAFLLVQLLFSQAYSQCEKYQGERYTDTDFFDRVNAKIAAPDPCECTIECSYSKLGFFRAPCTQEFDACTPCLEPCGDEECGEWVEVDEGEGDMICEQISVTPCSCCVQTDEYFLDVCATAPVYNNSCDQDLCGLCVVICDIPTCDWLDPLADHSPYSDEIAAIIRSYLLAVLSIDAFSACAPAAIEDIIMKLSGYIALDKCEQIHLSGQELAALTLYLDGGLGTPVCPCNCPDDEPLDLLYVKNGQIVRDVVLP